LTPWRAVGIPAIIVMLVGGCATQAHFPSASRTSPVTLSALVSRPEGTGPFPAMILLPACGGLEQHQLTWASWLNRRGYVTLVVDSLSPRSRSNVCRGERPPSPMEVGEDAVGALAYVRSLPYVAGDRVGVMGWSFGAGAALWIAGAQPTEAANARHGFRAAIAFYPPCGMFGWEIAVPVLLLLAEKDDWTPPGWCVSVAETAKARRGVEVELKVYPSAAHGFDNTNFGGGRSYLGHVLRYDGSAAKDAEQRVEGFLLRHLSAPAH